MPSSSEPQSHYKLWSQPVGSLRTSEVWRFWQRDPARAPPWHAPTRGPLRDSGWCGSGPSGQAGWGMARGPSPLTESHEPAWNHSHAERRWLLSGIFPCFRKSNPSLSPAPDNSEASHSHTLQLVGDSPVGAAPFTQEEMSESMELAKAQVRCHLKPARATFDGQGSTLRPSLVGLLCPSHALLGTIPCSPVSPSCSLDAEPGQEHRAMRRL